MRTQISSTPTRIDLAGGTLDIWPLNMLVPRAITVNVAIDLRATTVLEEVKGPRALIRSEDQGVEEAWEKTALPPADTKLPLIAECVRFFAPRRGLKVVTRCQAPAGSGLGGSSALAISLLGGLQAFLSRPIMPPDRMVGVARDLEARVLRIPTGTQDHFAAAYGGAAAIRYGPGEAVRESLAVDLEQVGARLVLAHTGASRLSASANWDMMRRALDGDRRTLDGLQAIALVAGEMRAALLAGDLDAAAALLGREWEERKKLSDKVSTPLIEKAIQTARRAGAVAGKVCGAGGGGCIAFLCRDGARADVQSALRGLSSDGVQVLAASPTRVGLQLGQ